MSLPNELKRLYKRGEGWRELFDALAAYEKRTTMLSAERAVQISGLAQETIIGGMKELDRLGVGEFKFGRRGGKTRLVWDYSPRSVGRVAQGKQEELESYAEGEGMVDDDASEEAADTPVLTGSVAMPTPILIEQAKRSLAVQLGVAPEQIEIIVRY